MSDNNKLYYDYLKSIGKERWDSTKEDQENYIKKLYDENQVLLNKNLDRTKPGSISVMSGSRPSLTPEMKSELLIDRKIAKSNLPVAGSHIIHAKTTTSHRGRVWGHDHNPKYTGSTYKNAIQAFKDNQSLYSKIIGWFQREFRPTIHFLKRIKKCYGCRVVKSKKHFPLQKGSLNILYESCSRCCEKYGLN